MAFCTKKGGGAVYPGPGGWGSVCLGEAVYHGGGTANQGGAIRENVL